ncbi:MAG: recombinase family protein [Eubacteriales bacterium]
MARKSKFSEETKESRKLWRPALYIRLSREDGDKEESDSVVNQQTLLLDFLSQQHDMTQGKIYKDDGWSGTNFQRPSFIQMMEDGKKGIIDCIIVKDLSRLGRNYIGVGEKLEQEFPLLNIRFISVNDGLDSFKNPQNMNTLVVPVKNIINDEYARDISKKVRSSLDLKRKQGNFIGSFASYGYLKDPMNKGKLIVDEEAAAVIQDIFSWFLAGNSIIGIAKKLNQLKIPNPSEYKKQQGFNYRHPSGDILDGLWPDTSVRRILKNKLYTGTMVQGKNRTKSYKLNITEQVPESEWIQVENTHEAIIAPEIFQQVQDYFSRDRRASPVTQKEYLFSGLLRCYDCKRGMNHRKITQSYGEYHYYYCSTYKKRGQCTKHSIRSDKLEQAVLEALQQQIYLAVEMDEVIEAINQEGILHSQSQKLISAQKQVEKQKEKKEKMKLSLYPDWKNGDISREEFIALKGKFQDEITELEENIKILEEKLQDISKGVDGSNPFIAEFKQYRNLQTLTRPVVTALIHMIYVKEKDGILIEFTFSDAFATAKEYIDLHKG